VVTVTEVLVQATHYNPVRLLDLLSDEKIPKVRLEAILDHHLARIPPRALITLLGDVGKETRPIVFRLVEKRADASVVPEALKLLDHEDLWVRTHMARLLGGFPGGGISGLIRLLMDPVKTVRLEAVKSLGRLKALAAVPQLCAALRDVDMKVHTAAIEALVAIGDPSAVGHLVDVLKDESEYARRGAVEVLNEVVTVEAIKDLVQALRVEDWWVRVRAADALGTLGGAKVVEAVIGLMRDTDEFIRRYAVEILNTIPDERAVEPLIAALDDHDWWVRERSIDALGRIGDRRAVDPLLTAATSAGVPKMPRLRIGDLRVGTFAPDPPENAESARAADGSRRCRARPPTPRASRW
jgi:serine/threonine-protein kinase